MKNNKAVSIGLSVLVGLMFASNSEANSGGVSGYSGQSTSCISCHGGGISPFMSLTGPSSMAAGQTGKFLLKISGGQKVNVGLDVSAASGNFVVTDAVNTQLINNEITHKNPVAVDANGNYTFSFDYTAPSTMGTVTINAAGLSTNGSGVSGSGQGLLSMNINVTSPPPPDPGPQPANPGLAPAPPVGPQPASQLYGCSYNASYAGRAAAAANFAACRARLTAANAAVAAWTAANAAYINWQAADMIYQAWVSANVTYQAWLAANSKVPSQTVSTPPPSCTPRPPAPGVQPANPGPQPPATIPGGCPSAYGARLVCRAAMARGLPHAVGVIANPAYISWSYLNTSYQAWLSVNATYQAWLAANPGCP